METWKTAKEIKDHYGLKSVATVRKWTHEGMPSIRCGRRLVRYQLQAVQDWIEQRGKN